MSASIMNPILLKKDMEINKENKEKMAISDENKNDGNTSSEVENKIFDCMETTALEGNEKPLLTIQKDSDSSSNQTYSASVDSGFDENSHDSSIITSAMIDEEVRLQKKLKVKEERLRREYQKQLYDEEMKKLRYKRLMNLLEKSQFYAEFMYEKVNKFFEKDKRKEKEKIPSKSSSKRKRPDTIQDFSEDIVSACKKSKLTDGSAVNTDKLETANKNNKIDCLENNKKEIFITSLGIEVSPEQPKLLEGAALRDYQLEGLNWLKLLFESGLNGILADEMGLGKTIQVISLICHLYESNVHGPFLIVGPLSTLPNWLIEFGKFAPQLPVILYHGSGKDRLDLRKELWKKSNLNGQKVFPVVLTSYEIPIKDEKFLGNIRWKFIIVDEGHRLKNYKTQLARTLSSFNSVNRLLLTGTPLQNNLTELWSLLHFLLPDIFDSLDAFQSWFEVEDIEREDIAHELLEQEKKDKILTVLHKILSPFLLRRVKAEVDLKLPPKKEVLVYCPMSQIQRKLYEAILDRSIFQMINGPEEQLVIPDNVDGTKVKRRSALRKMDNIQAVQAPSNEEKSDDIIIDDGLDQYVINKKLCNSMIPLRKTLNHPYLIQMPVLPGSNILRVDEGIVTQCGKFTVLDGLLSRLKKKNHKVIIFSTFTSILDLLEEVMLMRGYDYERLDGSCKLEDRKTAIHRYNTDPNVFVFLISTRAGGLGINLTSADTAIIYDSDWNPQADLQAQDRCHRIGQVRPVVVYRFITEGTLDEKIFSRASAKRKLEKLIIHGGKFNHAKQKQRTENFDLEELRELLNSKPECKELRTDGSVMTELEWDELLDRSDLLAAMKESGDQ